MWISTIVSQKPPLGYQRRNCAPAYLALLLLLVGGGVQTVSAQVLSSSIVGNVTNPSGAAVPDATIEATQTETNDTRETKTNESAGNTLSTIHAGTSPSFGQITGTTTASRSIDERYLMVRTDDKVLNRISMTTWRPER